MDEPWRPFPVPLLPAGESWLGAPNEAPPSAETDTIIGSLPFPVNVFERNSVQLKYTRPKNLLVGDVSTVDPVLVVEFHGAGLVGAEDRRGPGQSVVIGVAHDDELETLLGGDAGEAGVVGAGSVGEGESPTGLRLRSVCDHWVAVGNNAGAGPRRLVVEQPSVRPRRAAVAGGVDP